MCDRGITAGHGLSSTARPATLPETRGRAAMSDGARLHWTALGDTAARPPVVLLHGGPGLPDYLGELAPMAADLAPVFRYDQRGTGRSRWHGRHSLARHVADLARLLDAWEAPAAVLVGHSYGADLASRFCFAHPERVAAMLLMCGPFTGDWHARYAAERDRRMSGAQRARLGALKELPHRTEAELLTLSWFTDHAEPVRGRRWAARGARRRRPVNWAMNRELGEASGLDPLDAHLAALRARRPARTELLAGCEDPRPVSALASLARRLGVPLVRVEGAGHEPWRERPAEVRAHLREFVRGALGA
ncbi:alpha/beta hydrolase [Streptomyces sp. ODS28]|uniref:alpha/beta fold hydrolase n=1 Tax=Streptomyces sp. ODS28 TaxID=3136688 RepID=UPI0031EE5CD1